MAVLEREIQFQIRLAVGQLPGVVIWRNNTGVAEVEHGKRPTKIRYGLCVGSSDLIGICDSRFLSIEVKQPGKKPTKEQELFLSVVRSHGGFACVVTSVEEAMSAIERCRRGESQ